MDAASGPRYLPFVDFVPTLHGWRQLAETFPMEYTIKYHTTNARNLNTEWIGPRLYRAKLV